MLLYFWPISVFLNFTTFAAWEVFTCLGKCTARVWDTHFWGDKADTKSQSRRAAHLPGRTACFDLRASIINVQADLGCETLYSG
jgi:hypothetical protein